MDNENINVLKINIMIEIVTFPFTSGVFEKIFINSSLRGQTWV